MFWPGFVAGLFTGAFVATVFLTMIASAKHNDADDDEALRVHQRSKDEQKTD
jgi:hypothetical protein